MLTFKDFTDYCDLSEEEIQAITNIADITRIEPHGLNQQNTASLPGHHKTAELLQEHFKNITCYADAQDSNDGSSTINRCASLERNKNTH